VAEILGPLVRDSVRLRLVSDVPLGCFLSGGVDSTVVAAAATSQRQGLEALTVTFEDGEDESQTAARTASALGLEHLVERCTADQMRTVLDAWADLAADPLADPSLVPTRLVSQAARRRWTVALSGDGGDELLSGYPRLRLMPRIGPLLGLPAPIRRLPMPWPARRWAAKARAALRAGTELEAYQALQGVWPAAEVCRLTGRDEVESPWPGDLLRHVEQLPPWSRWRFLDATTFLPERVLAKVDRASMASSLEVRVPLLDHRIVELLLALPGAMVRGKAILRRVAGDLGAPAVPRAKTGFEVPLGRWLRRELRDPLQDAVESDTVADLGLDRKVIQRLWREHQDGQADHAERLLAVAVLGRWVDRWLG
jgi:asparagine synthase (glutamine-hydrolysing)